MTNKKFRILSILCVFAVLVGIGTVFASSYSGDTNNINPAVVNTAGSSGMAYGNNDMRSSVGEVGVSTFTSDSYFLYSGNLQTISYPLRVTNLSALTGSKEGKITLSWTAPGHDGTIGMSEEYDIRYSTYEFGSPALSEENFQEREKINKFSPVPSPDIYGTEMSMILTGLTPGTTYYFGFKARGLTYSWAFLSNGATACAAINYESTVSGLAQYNLSWQDISWNSWINFQQVYTTFTISDNNPGDTLRYNIQFSSYSDFSYLLINSTIPETSELDNPLTTNYLTTPLLSEGTWYWRINVTDDLGLSGQYITANSGNPAFKIDITSPAGAGISSIESHVSSMTVVLSEANGGIAGLASLPYSIKYSTSGSFDVLTTTETEWFDSISTQAVSLVPNTTYYFQARAKDNAGNISDWSEVSAGVTLCNPAPASWGNVYISSISVIWGAATPDNPPDTIYIVDLSTFADFSIIAQSSVTVNSANSALFVDLEPDTTYYVRLRVINAQGQTVISYPTPASRVTLCSDPNPSWGNIFLTSFTVTWIASAPDNLPNTEYVVEVATSADFTTITQSSYTVRAMDLSVITDLSVNTRYYSRVIARNWENINSTTVLASPESKSTLCNNPASPSWDKVYISSITIAWALTENPTNPDDTVYVAELSTASDFTGTLESSTTVRSAAEVTVRQLSVETTYYGRLAARNRDNLGAVTEISGSTVTKVGVLPPFAPKYLGQARSGNGIFIDWGTWTNNLTPRVSFYLEDANPADTVRFRIQASTFADFSINIIDFTSELIAQGATDYTLTGISENSTYYWRVRGIDNSSLEGNWTTANSGDYALRVDTTVPSVFELSLPVNGNWENSSVTFEWNLTDDSISGLNKYQLYVDGDLKEDNIPDGQNSVVSSLAGGNHSWYIKALDNAGNERNSSTSRTVNVDVTAPNSFGLSMPGDNEWKNVDNVTFYWNASGDPGGSGLNKYQLFIDGGVKEDSINPAQTSVTTNLSEGSHPWYVKAIDNVNNETQSSGTRTIKIDITSPTAFGLTSPSDNQWTNDTNVTFQWSASGDSGSGLSKYQLYVDSVLQEDNVPSGQNSVETAILTGAHTWYIRAIDNAGNQTNTTQTWTINVDTTQSSGFDITSPADNEWKNNSSVTFQWNASADSGSGLAKYQLYVDDTLKEDNIPSGQTSIATTLSEGPHTWYVRAVDNVNNVRQSNQTWDVGVDLTQPSIFSLSAPDDNSWTNSNNVSFNWGASADSGSGLAKYQLYVDGDLKEDNMPSVQTSTVSAVAEGSRNWYVKAVDNAGYSRNSLQAWTIKVDTTPPEQFNLVSPADFFWTNNNNVTFAWESTSDNLSGMSKYQLYIDDELVEDNISPVKTSTLTYLSDGIYTWYVKAVDNVNNQTQSSQARAIIVEYIPPGETKSSALPRSINTGGRHELVSATGNNNLTNSVGEIGTGVSTFTSASYFMYPGNINAVSYPGRITALSALAGTIEGEIVLSWVAPGADGTVGTCSGYDVRYSTFEQGAPALSEQDFQLRSSVTDYSPIPSPLISGTSQSVTITGLQGDTTYYFAIKARDANYSWSFLSCGTTNWIQAIPPAAVTNLSALAVMDGSVSLAWSAPGENGWSGIINNGIFRIDYATYSAYQFQISNYKFQITTNNVNPGDSQSINVTGLVGGTTYYFGIWTRDKLSNWSEISNISSCTIVKILDISVLQVELDFGEFDRSTETVSDSPIVVTNKGNVPAIYSIKLSTSAGWTSDATDAGNDVFALQAQFNSVRPSSDTFSGLLHGLTTTYQQCGPAANKFAGNDESGYQVLPFSDKHMWYFLKTPLSTSTTIQQSINIDLKIEEYNP